MTTITDPQIAVLIERVEHIARGIDELKPLSSALTSLQRDQEHMANHIKHLNTVAEMRGAAMHQLDKRVLVLERWHRFMLALPVLMVTIALALGGYTKSFLDSLDDYKRDTRNRITSLEFIINSPHFERSMEPNKPVAAGGK